MSSFCSVSCRTEPSLSLVFTSALSLDRVRRGLGEIDIGELASAPPRWFLWWRGWLRVKVSVKGLFVPAQLKADLSVQQKPALPNHLWLAPCLLSRASPLISKPKMYPVIWLKPHQDSPSSSIWLSLPATLPETRLNCCCSGQHRNEFKVWIPAESHCSLGNANRVSMATVSFS